MSSLNPLSGGKNDGSSKSGKIPSTLGCEPSGTTVDNHDTPTLNHTISQTSQNNDTKDRINPNDAKVVVEVQESAKVANNNSSWRFWQSRTVEEHHDHADHDQVSAIRPNISHDDPPINEPRTESWGNWLGSYKESMVGYVFYRNPDIHEQTPLLSTSNSVNSHQDTSHHSSDGNTQNGWWSWVWRTSNVPQYSDDDDDYEQFTNDVEMYKSAKSSIETSKDACSYAFKGTVNSQFLINDHELSVYGTVTQQQPVKYNIRRTPVTPAELQENSIQIVVDHPTNTNSTSNVNNINPNAINHNLLNNNNANGSKPNTPSPARTPIISSSNSSIHSNHTKDIELRINQTIPNIDENFRTITLLTKLRLLSEKILFQTNSSENHLYKQSLKKIENKKLHKIKKILVIGVHGFLPTKFVKSMVGQSSGNSLKFIEQSVKAIEKWLNDIHEPGFENMYNIETIALEGQGTIKERVKKSLKLLENWHHIINDCDFLFFVGHSQGSIISIKILVELFKNELLHLDHKKIGFLSMSGPLLGPIKTIENKIIIRAFTSRENEVLNELIQLSIPNSESQQILYKELEYLLNNNVKITLSGSVNDQLIPVESSLGNNFYHANIFRCLYIDNNCKLPSFVTILWKLILITRNIGHLEHGILKDLSERCIGNIDNGGYNKIFNDNNIYLTAIKFALETTNLNQQKDLKFITHHNDTIIAHAATTSSSVSLTDYLYRLPWSTRELIQDVLQTKHITNVKLVEDLIESYRNWEPTKHWKDYKFALDALSDIDFDDLII